MANSSIAGWAVVDDDVHSWSTSGAKTSEASLYGRRMSKLMADYWPTGTQILSNQDSSRWYASRKS
jgi:hypothetical protein